MTPHLRRLCRLLLALAVVISHSGCGKSPDKSAQQSPPAVGGQVTFLASGPEGGDRWKSSKKLPVPVSPVGQDPIEELAWLTAARDDPDPSLRLTALENWARNPGETLDPATYALVDPDESVRARAQELFEEALARQ